MWTYIHSPHYVIFINIIAAVVRDSEGSISTVQTLQDCGSSVPFMSECGLSQDPSSGIIHIIEQWISQMLGCGE